MPENETETTLNVVDFTGLDDEPGETLEASKTNADDEYAKRLEVLEAKQREIEQDKAIQILEAHLPASETLEAAKSFVVENCNPVEAANKQVEVLKAAMKESATIASATDKRLTPMGVPEPEPTEDGFKTDEEKKAVMERMEAHYHRLPGSKNPVKEA